jgi:hypothetical protein
MQNLTENVSHDEGKTCSGRTIGGNENELYTNSVISSLTGSTSNYVEEIEQASSCLSFQPTMVESLSNTPSISLSSFLEEVEASELSLTNSNQTKASNIHDSSVFHNIGSYLMEQSQLNEGEMNEEECIKSVIRMVISSKSNKENVEDVTPFVSKVNTKDFQLCALCGNILVHSCIIDCPNSHVLCSSCIEPPEEVDHGWIKIDQRKCPKCHEPYTKSIPCPILDQAIYQSIQNNQVKREYLCRLQKCLFKLQQMKEVEFENKKKRIYSRTRKN